MADAISVIGDKELSSSNRDSAQVEDKVEEGDTPITNSLTNEKGPCEASEAKNTWPSRTDNEAQENTEPSCTDKETREHAHADERDDKRVEPVHQETDSLGNQVSQVTGTPLTSSTESGVSTQGSSEEAKTDASETEQTGGKTSEPAHHRKSKHQTVENKQGQRKHRRRAHKSQQDDEHKPPTINQNTKEHNDEQQSMTTPTQHEAEDNSKLAPPATRPTYVVKSGSAKVRKWISPYGVEEDEIIESFRNPIVDLESILDVEREKQKVTYQALLDDNAKLETENKETKERLKLEYAKWENMKEELEQARVKSKEQDDRLKQVEGEVRAAAKRFKIPKIERGDQVDTRLTQLMKRVKMASLECEAKDQRMIELQTEIRLTLEFAQELQQAVDAHRLEEIRQKQEDGKINKASYYNPSNVVTKGTIEKSEVCLLQ